MIKLISSEKAVKLIELSNTLVIETERNKNKTEIKKEFEMIFDVKVESIKTLIKNNKKTAYIRLKEKNPAIDVATKLGMI